MYEGFTIKEAPLTLLTMRQQATLEKAMGFSGKHGASCSRTYKRNSIKYRVPKYFDIILQELIIYNDITRN